MCLSVLVLIAWIPPGGIHWQAHIEHAQAQTSFPRLLKKEKLSTSDSESQLNGGEIG